MTHPVPPEPAQDDPEIRLSVLDAAAQAATEHLAPTRSAVALFDQASRHAERRPELPAPLRTALAAVLAHAGERHRMVTQPSLNPERPTLVGLAGVSRLMLALAVAVLEAR